MRLLHVCPRVRCVFPEADLPTRVNGAETSYPLNSFVVLSING